MAGLALLAFLPLVFVVLLVTEETTARQLVFVQVTLVATHTLCRLVLAQQQILGLLVVIERDILPVLLDMAALALRAKITLVRLVIVLLVARDTCRFQLVLVQVALVATLALCRLVLAQQQILSLLVVIERDLLPVLLDVAAFALRAKITLVRLVIVLLVARDTCRLQLVLEQVALVATRALGFLVLAEQGILGLLVVIKEYLLPVLLDVAAFALCTEIALVFIVLLVALVANSRRFAVFLCGLVAAGAFHLLAEVSALQRIIGKEMIEFAMIESGDLRIAPLVFGMAFPAFLARIQTAVIAALPADVLVDLLVALFASLFFLGMSLDDFARHQQYVCLRLHGVHEQEARQGEHAQDRRHSIRPEINMHAPRTRGRSR